jgi:plastocyanin
MKQNVGLWKFLPPRLAITFLLMPWAFLAPQKVSAATTNIAVIDFQFIPSTVTIGQNDTIEWLWPTTNTVGHSTSGLGQWESGVLPPGSSYTTTFTAVGTFPFHCSVHPVQMQGQVQVQPVAPTIVTQPQGQSVLAGSNAVFTVAATGTPPLSYQWVFQGTNIPGATDTAIAILNVKDTNAGTYSVNVSNSIGVTPSTNAVLTVIPTAILTVRINGKGTVKPNLDGKLLGIGQTYTMTATPAAGYVFSNWSGTISTNSQKLTFQMQSNMALQANFAPGQFLGVKGIYRGLFYETGGVALASSGGFTLTTTVNGTFSGNLQMSSGRSSFSGHFETNGTAEVVARRRTGNFMVDLQIDLSGDSSKILGSLTDGTFNAPLSGDRSVFNTKTNPAPQAPRYTLVIPANPSATNAPQGDGFGTVTVNRSGLLQFSGTLADGTKVSQSSAVSSDGEWPLFVAFPGSRGSVLSWVNLGTTSTNALSGDVTWIRTPSTKAYGSGSSGSAAPQPFAAGFMVVSALTGFPYVRPASGSPILGFTDGRLVFTGVDLTSLITNDVVLNSNSRITNLSSNKLTLSFNLQTGTFRGTVADPNLSSKRYAFSGVALQTTNVGRGYFLGATQSGTVLLEAR